MFKSLLSWTGRHSCGLLIISTTLALTLSTAIFSLAQITRAKNFSLALRFSPREPIALANLADSRVLNAAHHPAMWGKAVQPALLSIRGQAINSRALRILAFAIQDNQPASAQRALATLAIRSSRREAAAHIWMIEDRVAHNDVLGALKHYDMAMRSSAEGRSILYPLLINAMEDRDVRRSLVPFLRARPDWLYGFLERAVATSANPSNVASIVEEAGGWPEGGGYNWLANGLLARMVAESQFSSAARHYLTLKRARPSLLVSPDITEDSFSDAHGVMAWQKLGTSSSGVDYVGNRSSEGFMHVYAASGDNQIVARKLLLLKPGTHQMTISFGDSRMPSGAYLKWSLTCLARARPGVVLQSATSPPKTDSRLLLKLGVPGNCEAVALDLEISAGQNQQGAEAVVKSITLSRLNAAIPQVPSSTANVGRPLT